MVNPIADPLVNDEISKLLAEESPSKIIGLFQETITAFDKAFREWSELSKDVEQIVAMMEELKKTGEPDIVKTLESIVMVTRLHRAQEKWEKYSLRVCVIQRVMKERKYEFRDFAKQAYNRPDSDAD